MNAAEFGVDPAALKQDGIALDEAAQKFLALEEESLAIETNSGSTLSACGSGLRDAVANFGLNWGIQGRIVAVQSAALSRQLLAIADDTLKADSAGASGMAQF